MTVSTENIAYGRGGGVGGSCSLLVLQAMRGGVASWLPVRAVARSPRDGVARAARVHDGASLGLFSSSWESALFDTSLGRARAACLRDASGAREPVPGPGRRRGGARGLVASVVRH